MKTPKDKYLHTGKEFEQMHGLNWYDNGARPYDPITGRFPTMYPLAEMYYDISPYAHCANNPILYLDPDGRKIVIGTWAGRMLGKLGFNTFERRVKAQIETLKTYSPFLKESIEKMENSDKTIQITQLLTLEGIENKGNYTIETGEGNSEIFYDPNNYETVNKNKRYPIIGLAHELGHAEDIMEGNRVVYDRKKALKGNLEEIIKGNEDEANAIMFENYARQSLKLKSRSYEYYTLPRDKTPIVSPIHSKDDNNPNSKVNINEPYYNY